MTPEGRVKAKVKAMLKRLQSRMVIYVDMPVPGGYGKSGLDFDIIAFGHAIRVETKAADKMGELTPRQRQTAIEMYKAGAAVFLISNDEGVRALESYLLKTAALFPSDWS